VSVRAVVVVARIASLIGCIAATDGCKTSGKARDPVDAQQSVDGGAADTALDGDGDAAADAALADVATSDVAAPSDAAAPDAAAVLDAAPVDGGNDAAPSPGLFTDPSVPRCAEGQSIQLRGMLDGQRIDDATTLASNLTASSFQVLEVVGGDVRLNVALTWDQPLAEDRAVPLTGARFVMREGQPFATESFCVTAGDFGSPALAAGAPGRTLLYRITGARRADCEGPEVPVALAGCAFRTDTFFPGGGGDGGTDGSSDAGSGTPTCGPDPVTDAAAPECNTIPISGPKLVGEPASPGDAGPAFPAPAGGVITDGDYQLVGYRTGLMNRSLRGVIRVTGGGTRIEWASTMWISTTAIDMRYNTRTRPQGTTLHFDAVECVSSDIVFDTKAYGYTAAGNELTFVYTSADGTLVNIYTYRRLCRR
jgi:hypothetical protein